MKAIISVLQVEKCSIGLLEVVVGGLIALLIYRRRMLCLLDKVCDAMKGRDQNCVISIGPELRQELVLCAGLLPFTVVELRADYCENIFAVDASNWGEAVTACPTSRAFAKETSRHALKKDVWTKLLAPGAARARGPGELDPSLELPGGPETSTDRMNLARLLKFLSLYRFKQSSQWRLSIFPVSEVP